MSPTAIMVAAGSPAKLIDSCCWEQILKILEENGFGKPQPSSVEAMGASDPPAIIG